MSEDFKFILFLVVVIPLCIIIWQIPRQIRSIRLKNIAKRFKLSFNKKFKIFYPDKNYNEIIGKLNGHSIKIYDSASWKYWATVGSGISSYRTIIQIDGVQTQSNENHFAKISHIEDELNKLTL
jgi:hypothetical protein